jgi:hypothetical protein
MKTRANRGLLSRFVHSAHRQSCRAPAMIAVAAALAIEHAAA